VRGPVLLSLLATGACALVGVPPTESDAGPIPPPAAAPAQAPGAPPPPVAGEPVPGPAPRPEPAPAPDAPPPPRVVDLSAGGFPERARVEAPTPPPAPAFGEVRALWVVRTTLTSPEAVRTMVERARRAGFNTLLVQVRGRGDAFYASTLEPRAEQLARQPVSFDPLGLVLEEAHAAGLAVHAWINTHLVWGGGTPPRDPGHLARTRPEALAVPRTLARELARLHPEDPRYLGALLRHAVQNSDRVEGVYTSPSHPVVQERLAQVVHELAERYSLDGIHMDYVRYASSEFDFSGATLDAFRAWALPRVSRARARELDRAALLDPLAWPAALAGPWDEFRRESVTRGVALVAAEARAARPGLLVSAAVFADREDAYRHRFQDWVSWTREGLLDVVVPMAYTPDDGLFRSQVEEAVERVGAGRVWAGIGAWQSTPAGTVSKIGLARELGARGFSLFSYDWLAEQRWLGGPLLERVLEGR